MADLTLEDIVSNAEKGVELDQKKAFLSAAATSVKDAKLEYNGKFSFRGEDVSKQLKNLRLPSENVAKVVPNRIFSLAVHPTTEKVLVAAGGKWGNVGLWDVNGTDLINNGVQLFKYHSRPVNCMTFNPYAPAELWSSSYDGTVRCFDLERQMTRVLYGDPEDEDAYVTYHSQVWPLTHFFLFPFCKNSLICLEGKSMTPHRGNTILFRSSQQLPRLRLGPSKGFLS